MRNPTLVLFTIFFALQSFSQNESKKWFFGTFAGLDFMSTPPTAISGSAMWTAEGCSSIADASGALLFYTNGKNVYNKNNTLMANGSGLLGEESSTQTGLIVKQPGNQNIYFVFSIGGTGQSTGLYYSIVDMSLAAGLGSVTIMNVPVSSFSTEKLAATSHCNGTDIWLASHEFGTDVFMSYLLTSAGLSTAAVTSSVGPVVNVLNNSPGQMKFSANGRRLGLACNQGNFELYDFDPATGHVSNPFIIAPNINYAYGCEFSPDGTKFYGSRFPPSTSYIGAQLLQWDLCAGSQSAIIASQFTVSMSSSVATADQCAALQIAPDGKIYISALYQQSLSVINNPNAAGIACGYSALTQTLQPGYVAFGLPSFVMYHSATTPTTAPFTWTTSCQTVSFTPPAVVTTTLPCGGVQQPLTSFQWLFGDTGASGTSSSSISNPQYAYSGVGTYIAKLVLHYPCKSDTISVPVTITQTVPLISVSSNTTLCLGETVLLTATGALTYSWNGTAGSGSIAVSPTTSAAYTVTGANDSSVCPTTSQLVSLTVLPCTNLRKNLPINERVYPNPMTRIVMVELEDDAELNLYDVSGKLLIRNLVTAGVQNLNTSNLIPGIYFLHIRVHNETRVVRLCKSSMD